MSDTYEIYAIRYGHHPRKAPENFIGGDPHDDDHMPLDYFVWAIVGARQNLRAATPASIRRGRQRRGRINYPADRRGAEGDRRRSGHSRRRDHLPHALRPRWQHRRCSRTHASTSRTRRWNSYTGRCMCHPSCASPFEAEHVSHMVHRVFDGPRAVPRRRRANSRPASRCTSSAATPRACRSRG